MKIQHTLFLLLCILFGSCQQNGTFTIQNENIARTIEVKDGFLYTTQLVNKRTNQTLAPSNKDEFQLRISEGTDKEGTDKTITSKDFTVTAISKNTDKELVFDLNNKEHGITIELHYEINAKSKALNKYMNITSTKDITLERIDVEAIALNDIYQPYKMNQITSHAPGKWRPGLGQPLYTSKTATFWGTEFPASLNLVKNGVAYCGYLYGKNVTANETYKTYSGVVGAGDDSKFIQDSFFEYIDAIRVRPLRLQMQYNSWFDFWSGVNKDKFATSVEKVNQELMTERGVPPFRAFVIDDGWQNAHLDWSKKVWQTNTDKFDKNFATSFANVNKAKSTLGLWLSPGCCLGGKPAVPTMRKNGLEALDKYMSLAGPKYMSLLSDRMLELTKMGVTYFKLDGCFGQLNRREYDINGKDHGVPVMPQLNTADLTACDPELNKHKYDELKTYYLVSGTEHMMDVFEKQHEINPDVYIVISNGAYLSPWWLMYIDAVWMINAGDAAGGSNRNEELVYRDGVYYDTWVKEHTQFPINSVFNHEPKKTQTGESNEQFSEYLWMNLSRGTGFVELYIVTPNLEERDWDVLADGLKWVNRAFPYFKYARMHGGNPKKTEVYGYTGWNNEGGYASFHNSSEQTQSYSFTLDRAFGLRNFDKSYTITSALPNETTLIGKSVKSGSEVTIELEPGEVKVLEFN